MHHAPFVKSQSIRANSARISAPAFFASTKHRIPTLMERAAQTVEAGAIHWLCEDIVVLREVGERWRTMVGAESRNG